MVNGHILGEARFIIYDLKKLFINMCIDNADYPSVDLNALADVSVFSASERILRVESVVKHISSAFAILDPEV